MEISCLFERLLFARCCYLNIGARWQGQEISAKIQHKIDLNIEPHMRHLSYSPLLAMKAAEWVEGLRREVPAELEKLRKARGLSKNELSARTGLARSFITTLEQGGATPSTETLGRIAFVLGISAGEILKRAEKRVGTVPRFRKGGVSS